MPVKGVDVSFAVGRQQNIDGAKNAGGICGHDFFRQFFVSGSKIQFVNFHGPFAIMIDVKRLSVRAPAYYSILIVESGIT